MWFLLTIASLLINAAQADVSKVVVEVLDRSRELDAVINALDLMNQEEISPFRSPCLPHPSSGPCPEEPPRLPLEQYTGGHNQIIFGRGPFYMNHLPLRYPPHNFQAIYEVAFPDTSEGRRAQQVYLRQVSETNFGSLEPSDSWRYPEFNCQVENGSMRSLEGRLHRGHLELDSGAPLALPPVSLTIRRRIFYREFPEVDEFRVEGASADPKASPANYIVFGEGQQFFAARIIERFPDAEHITPIPAASVAKFRALGDRPHACFGVTHASADMTLVPSPCRDAGTASPEEFPFTEETFRSTSYYTNIRDLSN